MYLETFDISYIALTSLLTPIVICGSLALVTAIVRNPERLSSHSLIASICVADACHAALLPLYTSSVVPSNGIQSTWSCILINRCICYTYGVLLLSIAAMSLFCFQSISLPQEHDQRMTPTKTIILILCVWLYPLLAVTIPVFANWYSEWDQQSGEDVPWT